MTNSVESAAEAAAREAAERFDTGTRERPLPMNAARQSAFVSGAEWQREQDESEAMRVAAQRAVRIRELEEGREMEQVMLRNAAARILELEQALEDSAARFRLLDANRSDAAAAMATRAEVAEARLDKIRDLHVPFKLDRPKKGYEGVKFCNYCSVVPDAVEWPCETIKILDERE